MAFNRLEELLRIEHPCKINIEAETIQFKNTLRQLKFPGDFTKEVSVYLQLLPLFATAHRLSPSEVAKYATKLAIVFCDYDIAINYLKNATKSKNHLDLITPCQFTLPDISKINLKLWRGLAKRHMTEGFFSQALKNADKIEIYTIAHRDELEANIRKEIESVFKNKLAEEWQKMVASIKDLTEEEFVFKNLSAKPNNTEIQLRYSKRIKEILSIPTNQNIEESQKNALARYKLSPEGKQELIKIEKEVREKQKQEFIAEYQKRKKLAETEQSIYIENQIQLKQHLINNSCKQAFKHILSEHTDSKTLLKYLANILYLRIDENPDVAELFVKFRKKEQDFDRYLDFKIPNNDRQMPNIFFDGTGAGHDEYYIKKLKSSDPRAPILGELTGCCQSIGNEYGEYAATYGITSPNAGFYVLCRKKGKLPAENDEIVAQCLAWKGKNHCIVFDSIESQADYQTAPEKQCVVSDMFIHLSLELTTQHDIPKVLVGSGGNTPKSLHLHKDTPETPIEIAAQFNLNDSHSQFILADKKNPLLALSMLSSMEQLAKALPSATKNNFLELFYLYGIHPHDEEYAFLCQHKPASINTLDLSKILQFIKEANSDTPNWEHVRSFLAMNLDFNFHSTPDLLIKLARDKQFQLSIKIDDKIFSLAESLILKGMKLDTIDKNYKTAMDYAIENSDLNSIKFLVGKGANYQLLNFQGWSYLRKAIETERFEIADYFISLGVNINEIDSKGSSIFHTACEKGRLNIIKYLLNHHAKIDIPNANGETPLHIAAEAKQLEIVNYLLTHGEGINVNVKSRFKQTPLDLAVFNKAFHVADLLIANGARVDLLTPWNKRLLLVNSPTMAHNNIKPTLHPEKTLNSRLPIKPFIPSTKPYLSRFASSKSIISTYKPIINRRPFRPHLFRPMRPPMSGIIPLLRKLIRP